MSPIERRDGRDRAVSISITHVLTVGITTILIAILLTSAGTMLDSETDRSADSSLETIGERLADEIGNADQIGARTTDNATIRTDHPRTVANARYTVELLEDCDAPLLDGNTDCVKLSAHNADAVAYVPIKTDATIVESSTAGGTIAIVYENGEISIEDGNA
ncbi:DUF7266 family protein [Natrinema caseinilyticum]|uniref:DUF7266 family protein n=1 Tax=Natrinema caseinilyticum TaxID=2961570 RepID=UPI0020C49364|nr:hypothetical protein [Natrinema caseinilyticum]